ncbi:kinase-regulated stress-responsive transcription factor skn7, partial [Borealophlyctis nickersoniae]
MGHPMHPLHAQQRPSHLHPQHPFPQQQYPLYPPRQQQPEPDYPADRRVTQASSPIAGGYNHQPSGGPTDGGQGAELEVTDNDGQEEAGDAEDKPSPPAGTAGGSGSTGTPTGAGIPEFVKKLFKMLEDQTHADVVSWGIHGDTFVVKERTEFERSVLPKHFKHNNFASFVRQLNKYDFHKIRSTDDGKPYGEQAWEFQHPMFQFNKRELLESIKRKAPSKKASATANGTVAVSGGAASSDVTTELRKDTNDLQSQVDSLMKLQSDMATYLQSLSRNYHMVVEEVLNFRRNMAAQDQAMRNLVDYLVGKESGALPEHLLPNQQPGNVGMSRPPEVPPFMTPFAFAKNTMPPAHFSQIANGGQINSLSSLMNPGAMGMSSDMPKEAHGLLRNYTQEIARASFQEMHEISQRVNKAVQSMGNPASSSVPPLGSSSSASSSIPPFMADFTSSAPRTHNGGDAGSSLSTYAGNMNQLQMQPGGANGGGLTVFTVGGLAPRRNEGGPANSMRVTRTTLVPSWAVPPRVLLVDDDDINRKMSTRLLQVFGCSIDVAVDGVDAVERMGVGNKYDIVLMDIVMPNLDGVSATQSIRKFDSITPIISMTANTTPNDCVRYLENGMNDVLPKPFNKANLLGIVERYCNHLLSQHAANMGIPKSVEMGFGRHPFRLTGGLEGRIEELGAEGKELVGKGKAVATAGPSPYIPPPTPADILGMSSYSDWMAMSMPGPTANPQHQIDSDGSSSAGESPMMRSELGGSGMAGGDGEGLEELGNMLASTSRPGVTGSPTMGLTQGMYPPRGTKRG